MRRHRQPRKIGERRTQAFGVGGLAVEVELLLQRLGEVLEHGGEIDAPLHHVAGTDGLDAELRAGRDPA